MKIINILIISIVALLSIAAGLAKIMQNPQEMAFLQSVGLSTAVIIVFGTVQVLGGVLLVPPRTRMFGAVLVTFAFFVSVVLIFLSGNVQFALVSLLPVILGGVLIYRSYTLKDLN